MGRFRILLLCAVIVAAGAVGWYRPIGFDADQAAIFGIVMVTLALWATSLVPGYLASLFLFAALLIAGLAPADVVFSGFASGAMWLIVSGFVIGSAISQVGLDRRLGDWARPRLSRSYPALIAGLMGLAMAMGFVMPSSMGRAAVLVPVGMALAEACGFARGSAPRIGIAATIAIGTNMPSFAILPSNIPNVILAGLAEQNGVPLGYTDYLALHYPVLGLVKSALVVGLVLVLFPGRTAPVVAGGGESAPTASRARQWGLMAVLLVTLALWATDSLHGINPAWVSLGTMLVLLAPKIGFVPPRAFKGSIDFSMLLFVAGALGLGTVVSHSGLGAVIAHHIAALLPLAPGQDFLNFVSLVALTAITAIFTTMIGVPAVLTPLAGELSQATGFSPHAVMMTQVIGFSTVLFPYQIGPLVVTMGLAGESVRPLAKVTLALAVLTFLVIVPLDFLWWKALGEI